MISFVLWYTCFPLKVHWYSRKGNTMRLNILIGTLLGFTFVFIITGIWKNEFDWTLSGSAPKVPRETFRNLHNGDYIRL